MLDSYRVERALGRLTFVPCCRCSSQRYFISCSFKGGFNFFLGIFSFCFLLRPICITPDALTMHEWTSIFFFFQFCFLYPDSSSRSI
jgi:hypothetical protein